MMPKIRRKSQRAPETSLERLSRLARERILIEDTNAPLINEFAQRHGNYARDAGERKSTLTINQGGTTVDRWKNAKPALLTETQIRAIDYCIKLWSDAQTDCGVVANLMRVGGVVHMDGWKQQEALDELAKLKAQVARPYWEVFERVCRFDEPAGVAGSRLTNNTTAQSTSARLIVCFVADLISMWRRL